MELRRYFTVLRRRWALLVACALAGLIASYLTTPSGALYQASTMIYVGNRQFGDGSLSEDRSAGVERVARTFAVMLASEPIAREAIERTSVPASSRSVAARTFAAVVPNTSLIRVVFLDSDPVVAQVLANALSDALVEKVQDFEPGIGTEGSVPVLPAYVFARAELPLVPQSNGGLARLLTGGFFGLVVAAGLAFLIDYLDITPGSAEDLERHLGLPVLGAIPAISAAAAQRVVRKPSAVKLREIPGA